MKVFSYQVRTLGAKPSAFLRSWLLLVLLLGQGALGAKSLPKEAKQKIEQKLANEPKDHLVSFTEGGKYLTSVQLKPEDTRNYNDLVEFLKNKTPPVSECKNPEPAPPPPCVICDGGRVICTKAFTK